MQPPTNKGKLPMPTKKKAQLPAKKMPATAKKTGKKPGAAKAPVRASEKRVYFKQADFPLFSLQEAQRVAAALMDDFGGREGSPPDVALSIGASPTSSTWRDLAGAAIAYGLTEGGPNAIVIKLLALGKRLVAPEEEGEDLIARREAIMKPRIAMEFYERYRRAKFPSDVIASNVLKSLGIPADRVDTALGILKANGQYAGVIRETRTGPFINLDSPGVPGPTVATPQSTEVDAAAPVDAEAEETNVPLGVAPSAPVKQAKSDVASNRVFITHGKRREIVNQIKELLTFGSFEPVVSVERESTAIPVPEKVFEDMRGCAAGVIHVGSEGKYLDREGTEHTKINDNVLIEIGAAMALYGKKVILLVERGVSLPSNLQGLYRCEFEGDKLDYDSTMKLLKTFSQFR
ncbi:nucleotide-binding protein [Ideonella sp. 4Y11]|uniref:Nucleotide-binding protein n=1 Tax=Ideonella aquatica TaxID=2824119 RepID=A0A940YIH5_9BURK|nr:TIR domain-containing protein [Ideonella aquatica]MBQ0960873.1 nucleotide-binding protein [Ideonella aquatica]